MKYKSVAKSLLVIIFLIAILIAFFSYLSFSDSLRYRDTFIENATNSELSAPGKTTVIIDAGHGGADPGAIANGLIEKELNLAVAVQIKDFLCISGYDVIMTRNSDVLLGNGVDIGTHKNADLRERLSYIDRYDNCVFVSIHMNKFEASSARGLQTFYSDNCDKSAVLAKSIQESSLMLDANNKRSIKPDDNSIFILEHAYKPSVLVECGFLSNPIDAEKLSSEDYRNKLAFCIYNGITKYLGDL